MKKLLLLLITLALTTVWSEANPLTVNQAKEAGAKFAYANGALKNSDIGQLELVGTYYTETKAAALFIFNMSNGYVIVSADDRACPILGYSDEGPIDIDDMPVQMDAYLRGFTEQIQYAIENLENPDSEVANQWALVLETGRINDDKAATAVSPLISSKWAQGCYYNIKCPTDSQGQCGHTLTGCTGTAMGQIMHFWSYPVTGYGSTSYKPTGYPTQSVNFGNTTYDWNNMPNMLSSGSSSIKKNAVGTLLWHCGVALHAAYGPTNTGASPEMVPSVLTTYFRYSPELFGGWKSATTNSAWLSQCKQTLNNGCPIHYSAWTALLEGHSFVCDGYNSSGQLHFNWGWGGNYNGYFAVYALNVAGYYFNYDHYAVFDIHPNGSYNITTNLSQPNSGVTTGDGTYSYGDSCSVTATANSGYIFRYWAENYTTVSYLSTYTFTVTRDRTLTACFSKYHNVTTSSSPAEGGTTTGGGTYYASQSCTVHAIPNDGYIFDHWENNGVNVSTSLDYTFTVYGDVSMVAFFTATGSCDISASCNPEGAGAITGMGTYTIGTSCVLTASCNAGYSFASWTENDSIVSTEATYAFTVTADRALTANFEQLPTFEIVTAINPENAATVSGAGTYYQGETCSLSVSENAGYEFVSWTENDTVVSSVPGYTFVVTCDRNLIANFNDTNFFNITASSNPANGGTIIGTGYYNVGQTCTLIAKSNLGYSFNKWTENGATVSTSATLSFTISSDRNLIACFDELNYDFSSNCPSGQRLYFNVVDSINKYVEITCPATNGWTGFTKPTGRITLPETITYDGVTYTVTGIGDRAFYQCNQLVGGLTIPNTVTYIGKRAFYWCTSMLEPLVFGESLTLIDEYAFAGCVFISDLNFPDNLLTINSFAFAYNTGLTDPLIIPDNVTTIGSCAFYGTSNFSHFITIGKSVSNIGNDAFEYNSSISRIYCRASNPPTIGSNTFSDFPTSTYVSVPCGKSDEYQDAEYWSNFTNYHENYTYSLQVLSEDIEKGTVSILQNPNCTKDAIVKATSADDYEFSNWTSNGEIVSTDSIYTFTVTEDICLVAHFNSKVPNAQSTPLYSGWNWYSTFININGSDGFELLSSGLGENGIIIKTQSEYSSYLHDYGDWFGSLTTADCKHMYMINMSESQTLTITGDCSNADSIHLTVNPEWNWLSYPVTNVISINNALSGFTASDGDVIKSNACFSTYYDDYGWVGSLTQLMPGQGYQYKSLSSETKMLTYSTNVREFYRNDVTKNNNHWQPDIYAYPFNMSVTAAVTLDNQEQNSDDFEIAAFCNCECRGSAKPIYVDAMDRYVFFLTINGEDNDIITFKLFDNELGQEFANSSMQILNYKTDAVVGNVVKPFILDFNTNMFVEETEFDGVELYPNPVPRNQMITLSHEVDRIEVFKVCGIKIAEYNNTKKIDGVGTSGIYIVRITDDAIIRHVRIIVN